MLNFSSFFAKNCLIAPSTAITLRLNFGLFLQRYIFGIIQFPRFLRFLMNRKVEPIFVSMIDNRAPKETDRIEAFRFLRSYGLHLAKGDPPVANILPNMFDLYDYETVYFSREQYKRRGFQAVASANIMGLSTLKILDRFVLEHPIFGKCMLLNNISVSQVFKSCVNF
jgi:hypothetical protein